MTRSSTRLWLLALVVAVIVIGFTFIRTLIKAIRGTRFSDTRASTFSPRREDMWLWR
jgi:hypothetical protein